jgi:hypothetical protein
MGSATALILVKPVTIAIRNETRQRERAHTVLGRRGHAPTLPPADAWNGHATRPTILPVVLP